MALRYSVAVLVVGLVVGSTRAWGGDAEEQIEKAFYSYKAAIMNDRGAETAALLSSATARYYEDMRDLALYATESELKGQSTINLIQALTLRHRIPADRLRSLSGHELLEHALNRGWVGKNSVAPFVVKAVHVVEDTAVVDVGSERQAGTAQLQFVREAGVWKLDLLFMLKLASTQFDLLARQQETTREELLFTLLSSLSGAVVDETIWQPPLSRPE